MIFVCDHVEYCVSDAKSCSIRNENWGKLWLFLLVFNISSAPGYQTIVNMLSSEWPILASSSLVAKPYLLHSGGQFETMFLIWISGKCGFIKSWGYSEKTPDGWTIPQRCLVIFLISQVSFGCYPITFPCVKPKVGLSAFELISSFAKCQDTDDGAWNRFHDKTKWFILFLT